MHTASLEGPRVIGRLPPAGWDLLSPEQRQLGWAGCPAQVLEGLAGGAFQPQEVEPGRLPLEPDSLQLQAQVGALLKLKARWGGGQAT